MPVLIRAGALGRRLPRRDLMVSPLHAMYLDSVLVPAIELVNGRSIIQLETIEKVEYVHLELDTHDVILAEGALSETFVDDDSRGMFHNAADYHARYPEAEARPALYCAPRVTEGYALDAIRRRINERAGLAQPAPPVPLRGRVDEIRDDLVLGWAQTPSAPEVPVCMDVVIDGHVAVRALANRFRHDLAAAGLGSGNHAFAVRLPFIPTTKQRATAVVRRSTDHAPLESAVAGQRTGPSPRGVTSVAATATLPSGKSLKPPRRSPVVTMPGKGPRDGTPPMVSTGTSRADFILGVTDVEAGRECPASTHVAARRGRKS
jgi:hypothetical protein